VSVDAVMMSAESGEASPRHRKASWKMGRSQPLRLVVDRRAHGEELRRFEANVVRGPGANDCAIWAAAVGADGYGLRITCRRDKPGACAPVRVGGDDGRARHMRRASFEWLLSRRRKWWPQIFEHGEVSYVEGCQLQPLDIRGCCDEVITESNTGVTAAISAHHFAGTTGDDLCGRFCAKG
jgi:hypothetical protein